MPPRKRRSVDYPACILQQKPALGTQRAAQFHVVVETATWLVNHCGGYIRKRRHSTEHRLAGREQADVPFQSHGQRRETSTQPVVHPAHLPTRPPVAVRRDVIARRCDELIADLRAPVRVDGARDPPPGGGPRANLPALEPLDRASAHVGALGETPGTPPVVGRELPEQRREGLTPAAYDAPRGGSATRAHTRRPDRRALRRRRAGFGLPRHQALKVTRLRRPRSRCSSRVGVAHPGRGC